jgi:hypothetical protein
MYVYSGNCRLCEAGQPIDINDYAGNPLHTGDIVLTFTEDPNGCTYVGALTVVVSDQYQTYSDGAHVEKTGDQEFYIMGIKGVDITDGEGEWKVKKIKGYADVVDGEHWPEWGFSFCEV